MNVVAPPAGSVVLRSDDGTVLPLDQARWHADPSPAEEALLAGMAAPVLDVGCGPGRLVAGLARAGKMALGVDPAPAAVALAQRRGAAVLRRSVFDPLPGHGRWRTIILADGNIGIGGDPDRLLRRCHDLLAPEGTIVVEVEPPAGGRAAPLRLPSPRRDDGWRRYRVRLERGASSGPWFNWAVVDADAIARLATEAGLQLVRLQHIATEDRWFAHLGRASARGRSGAVA
jgi:SAM-dependent methyltransferase